MSAKESPGLSVHHVGGRAGTRDFPMYAGLEADLVSVLYEADPAAIEQMEQRVAPLPSRSLVVCACLGAVPGPATFNLYRSGYGSSLYEVDRHEAGYAYDAQFGWDLDPSLMALAGRVSVDVATLDGLLASGAVDAPPPDFLSLDTQGSELDVLRGAQATLEASVLAVQTEVAFRPTYRGQARYEDIVRFLEARGFELARLRVFGVEGVSDRLPLGLRGKGYVTEGDALFLRRPDAIAGCLPRLKLAFFNFLFEFYERAFAALDRLRRDHGRELARVFDAHGDRFHYLGFLRELGELPGRHPRFFPVSYDEVLGDDALSQRFATGAATLDRAGLWRRYFADRSVADVRRESFALLSEDDTLFEALCRRFGFLDHCETIRERRKAQVLGALMRLGIVQPSSAAPPEFRWEDALAALESERSETS